MTGRHNLHQYFFFTGLVGRGIFPFDFRDGYFLDGVKHVAKVEVFPFIIAPFEDVRGHGAGAQPLLAGGGGGCNVIANLRIMLHGVARRHIGGRWGFGSG